MRLNFMLDLETLSVAKNAAVTQIGVVAFDLDAMQLVPGGEFSARIRLDDAVRHGHVSGSTVEWWLRQDDAAREGLIGGKAWSADAARDLSNWMAEVAHWYGDGATSAKIDGVWGNGATFDLVLMASLFEEHGIILPWTYKAERCYRTIYNVLDRDDSVPYVFEGVKHSALDDARSQALHLIKLLKKRGVA